jgi:hypothetical protein
VRAMRFFSCCISTAQHCTVAVNIVLSWVLGTGTGYGRCRVLLLRNRGPSARGGDREATPGGGNCALKRSGRGG